MNARKVFIQSIPRDTATKISDWVNDSSGQRLQKTKVGRSTDTIQALYSGRMGGLLNGLSYKPWMEDGVQKVDESGRKLTLQDREEQRWGLQPGYLTNRPWRKGDSSREEDMTYFQRKAWRLNDGSTVLDLNNFDDAMFYYVALDSKLIANSESDRRKGLWPKATHFIALENEAEEIKYHKNQVKSSTFAKLHDKDLTPVMKKLFIHVLELANTKAYLTDEQVHNLLFDYIDKSDFREGSNIDKFSELYQLLQTATGRDELNARLLLQKLLDSRIIYEKQGSYRWNKPSGLITIGDTYAEAVGFLLNPKKSTLVEDLEKELTAKLI